MIETAQGAATDSRLAFTLGSAEQLPYQHSSFDLLIGATSFDHWDDQAAGLAQCARVLTPGGALLLTDLFSVWLTPTLVGDRADKARTKKRASQLLTAAGFTEPAWHGGYLPFLNTLTATKV
jgi:ubiquinone/menaquinone biosynthesis C-methylase UbiE